MKLSIEHKGNDQYAKISGKSYRVDGKVRKKDVACLGRVIDLEKGDVPFYISDPYSTQDRR